MHARVRNASANGNLLWRPVSKCSRKNIIYCSKKYINNLDTNFTNKKDILKKIEENKKNETYNIIYKALKVYKSLHL